MVFVPPRLETATIAAGVSYDPRVPESPSVGVPVLIVKWHTRTEVRSKQTNEQLKAWSHNF